MYYSYVKKINEEIPSLGVSFQIVARPKDNQALTPTHLVEKVIETSNPLVRTDGILYEITSDTTCVKKLELTAPDYYGKLQVTGDYPAEVVYKQYYYEQEDLDTTVVARVYSNEYFTFDTLTYTQALAEAKTLEDDVDFEIVKTADEIKWEKSNRLSQLNSIMAKKALILSELAVIAEANADYSIENNLVDTFVDATLIDSYNSDEFKVENINNEFVLVAVGDETSFILQSQALTVDMTHCFVMGSCISGEYSVQISNDDGAHWETATFDEVSKSKVSNEITFSHSPTTSVLVKLTMQKGNLGYNPILSSWGILWKNV